MYSRYDLQTLATHVENTIHAASLLDSIAMSTRNPSPFLIVVKRDIIVLEDGSGNFVNPEVLEFIATSMRLHYSADEDMFIAPSVRSHYRHDEPNFEDMHGYAAFYYGTKAEGVMILMAAFLFLNESGYDVRSMDVTFVSGRQRAGGWITPYFRVAPYSALPSAPAAGGRRKKHK